MFIAKSRNRSRSSVSKTFALHMTKSFLSKCVHAEILTYRRNDEATTAPKSICILRWYTRSSRPELFILKKQTAIINFRSKNVCRLSHQLKIWHAFVFFFLLEHVIGSIDIHDIVGLTHFNHRPWHERVRHRHVIQKRSARRQMTPP